MHNNVALEIWEYTRQIVKNTIGTQAEVKGFEWSDGGGLFNKVFKVNTTDGNFILKIECDKIFFATRKDQIENEVLGNEMFQKAGIPCANILAYDFTKNNNMKARYIFTECLSPDWLNLDDFDETTRAEIKRQVQIVIEKEQHITNSHFGSLSPSGTLGWHETYDGYYHSTLNLLIKDGDDYGVFTDEERETVKMAAETPLVYSKKYNPTFVHGDLAYHNLIWGNINGGENKLYVIDFGNAYFGLPYMTEIYGIRREGVDIIDVLGLERNLYENNLISDFERMFWRETERLTEDYTYCREWMISSVEAAKKDKSRTHITDFVEKCRKILQK
ncbi:MAG: phosphotransferase [Oscillospiraceae bacterium]|nr:phosphotransferase [Oscillospiraceae bacterium]